MYFVLLTDISYLSMMNAGDNSPELQKLLLVVKSENKFADS